MRPYELFTKLAAQELPEIVAHPYEHSLKKELVGGLLALPVAAVPGMWAGRYMASRDHAKAIAKMGPEADKLPMSVRHPYLTQTAFDFTPVSPFLSSAPAALIHDYQKRDYLKGKREAAKAAYALAAEG